MTLTKKIESYLQTAESRGLIVATSSNNSIMMGYYRSIGVDGSMTVTSWLFKQSEGKIPYHTSIERAIRKCRELHPHWRKPSRQKQKEVTDVKDEVGYK